MADRGSGRRSIVWMILAPTPIIVAISLVVVAVLIPILVERKVNEVAQTTALEKVRQFRAVRELYTDDVVEKVLAHPDFEASPDHAKRANAIPSPATFIIELSRVLRREGIQMKLYSPFPFNNRFGRVLDDFGRWAWDQLEKNSDAVVTEQTEKLSLRTPELALRRTFFTAGSAGASAGFSCVGIEGNIDHQGTGKFLQGIT